MRRYSLYFVQQSVLYCIRMIRILHQYIWEGTACTLYNVLCSVQCTTLYRDNQNTWSMMSFNSRHSVRLSEIVFLLPSILSCPELSSMISIQISPPWAGIYISIQHQTQPGGFWIRFLTKFESSVVCTMNEGKFLKFYWINILHNFNTCQDPDPGWISGSSTSMERPTPKEWKQKEGF